MQYLSGGINFIIVLAVFKGGGGGGGGGSWTTRLVIEEGLGIEWQCLKH